MEVRYRTNYIRTTNFNRSILHRDMYYSSLASLTDAAKAGFPQKPCVSLPYNAQEDTCGPFHQNFKSILRRDHQKNFL